ncbi:MAG: hypothetical protein ACI4NO_03925 [Oxalobacter sp.]
MFGLIIAIAALAVVVFFQVRSFKETKELIEKYAGFFPPIRNLGKLKSFIPQTLLANQEKLEQFTQSASLDGTGLTRQGMQDGNNVSLISTYGTPVSEPFATILKETNLYICKNAETAADFSILQDICDKKLEVIDNQINSRLNAPLYFGLGGTFIGIIIGVLDLAFNSALGSTSNFASLKPLLFGIGIAMIASLMGLSLMLYNTFWVYGKTSTDVENSKNDYFDFLRQELMPTLNNTLSASLNAVKEVLGHFVGDFGNKLDKYADSLENFKDSYALLNQNLDKQKQILDQIDRIGPVEMTKSVTRSFKALSDATDALDAFSAYQQSINGIVSKMNTASQSFNSLTTKFQDFANNIESVVVAQWRNSYDALTQDSMKVSQELQNQLATTTQYIQSFAQGNAGFFIQMNSALQDIAEYSRRQSDCYEDFRQQLLESRHETLNLQKQLLEFIKEQQSTSRIGIQPSQQMQGRNSQNTQPGSPLIKHAQTVSSALSATSNAQRVDRK